MENVNLIWLAGSLAFLGGGLCGALLYHLLAGSSSRNGKLAGQLDELQQEFRDYQDKVSDHFTTTAHLINKLTDTYRDVHEHMANGAESLCRDDSAKATLGDALLGSNALASGKTFKRRTERATPVEQPRDYAPKIRAEDKGTLAEDFGIKTSKEEATGGPQ